MTKKNERLQKLEYEIRRLSGILKTKKKVSSRYSWYRLIAFLTAVIPGILIFILNESVGFIFIVFSLIIFGITAYFHNKLIKSIVRYDIWLSLKLTHTARIKLDWDHIPEPVTSKSSPEHPFEKDLDITGKYSLHRLIDISISREGGDLLKSWLLETRPDLQIIQKRQSLIRELRPLSRFRDRLLLNFKLVSKDLLEGKKLLNTLQNDSSSRSLKWVLILSAVLAVFNVVLLILNQFEIIPAYWTISFTLYVIVYFMNFNKINYFFEDALFLNNELGKFREVLIYLETYPYKKNINLIELCKPFLDQQNRPSVQLNRIKWITASIGLRMNPMMAFMLNIIGPWDYYFAHRLNQYKSKITDSLPIWLDTWFELEALISLSDFAYLNPDYTFPGITSDKENIIFQAESLGHPLIPNENKVCNDFSLHHQRGMILVTGSNMSGKSTFLRTLGINLCLAYAGAPVNAEDLKISMFRIFACIKISDSLTDGVSYFYAEVKRLKTLLSEIKRKDEFPVFFLIDEIFKGTNNLERLIGSRSYIRELTKQNGLGAISTHDLELTKLADTVKSLRNYHFREYIVNGKMKFDYRLHDGPSPTTNALKIMQIEGLPVEEEGMKE